MDPTGKLVHFLAHAMGFLAITNIFFVAAMRRTFCIFVCCAVKEKSSQINRATHNGTNREITHPNGVMILIVLVSFLYLAINNFMWRAH